MASRSKTKKEIFIITSATLFATLTRDAQEIANMLGSSKRSIHRWAEEPLWREVLDTLGYTGERNFRVHSARDPAREHAETFEAVKNAYQQAKDEGIPKHKRASTVSEQTGVRYWRVWDWVRKHGWDD